MPAFLKSKKPTIRYSNRDCKPNLLIFTLGQTYSFLIEICKALTKNSRNLATRNFRGFRRKTQEGMVYLYSAAGEAGNSEMICIHPKNSA
jgi:hypothetical protein